MKNINSTLVEKVIWISENATEVTSRIQLCLIHRCDVRLIFWVAEYRTFESCLTLTLVLMRNVNVVDCIKKEKEESWLLPIVIMLRLNDSRTPVLRWGPFGPGPRHFKTFELNSLQRWFNAHKDALDSLLEAVKTLNNGWDHRVFFVVLPIHQIVWRVQSCFANQNCIWSPEHSPSDAAVGAASAVA